MNMELTQPENKSAVMAAVANCVEVMAEQIYTRIANDKELVSVVQALRSTNTKLLNRAMQLEQTVVECKQELQTQQEQTLQAESHAMQKTQELAAAHALIESLKQELTNTHQTVQQQQILLEGLHAQFYAAQAQANQAEREWLEIQTNYNQQGRKMRQIESECQELHNRLKRYAEHNAQLKIAINKCHESTSVNYESSSASTGGFSYIDEPSHGVNQAYPHAQPIPPWSARIEPTSSSPHEAGFTTFTKLSDSASSLHSEVSLTEHPEVVSTWEHTEEHDAVWQLLNDSSLASDPTVQDTIEVIEIKSASATTVEVTSTPEAQTPPVINSDGEPSVASASTPEPLDDLQQWEDSEFYIPNSNWPSPVVNRARTKKRSSLAAVELPVFAHL